MIDSTKTISEYIQQQFPAVYRENGDTLIAFIQAYFEFLENGETSSTQLIRGLAANRDIDYTLDQFVVHFKEKYLAQFPFVTAIDKRFVVKHIMDYYRSKGTPLGAELLIRILFNQDANVYLPGGDVLRASDSKWNIPRYLEVSFSDRTRGFVNKQVTGTISLATAFVEGVVTKRVQGRYIDIVYLSDIKGTFVTGELITDDGLTTNAPKVTGSLTSIDVVNGGQDNVVGDIFSVVDSSGRQGKARVSAIENATGRVSFSIDDGGSGYTLNTPDDGDDTNDHTNVRVATAMISIDNSNTSNPYLLFETVKQPREEIDFLSGTDINSTYFANTVQAAGDYLVGVKTYVESYTANGTQNTFSRHATSTGNSVVVTANGALVPATDYTANSTDVIFDTDPAANTSIKVVNYVETANALIVSVANTDANGDSIAVSSANGTAVVITTSGTFGNQLSIDFTTSDAPFANGEVISEEQTVVLNINSTSGSFQVGETVEMTQLTSPSAVGNTTLINAYAYGVVTAANSTQLDLEPAFGTFISAETITGANSAATATINSSSISVAGATGILTSNTDANTWVVQDVSGTFTVGKTVRGSKSLVVEEISALSTIGASDIWYNANVEANAIVDSFTNTAVSGIVVGQNSTYVGLYGNTTAFSFVANAGITINTDRTTIRALDLTAHPNKNLAIISIATGGGATFEPGSLENEEVVTLNTDLVGGNNIVGVNLLDINIDGSNSGVGFVDSLTINSGGTGYANDAVIAFTGGGFADGEPIVQANATITTDGSGTITSITVVTAGEGFYSTPTITLPATGGTEANVEPVMDFGYGLFRNPQGDSGDTLEDLFTFESVTIGSISSLNRINPGSNYNVDPFTSVHNSLTAGFNRKNIRLDISIVSGSFQVGEGIVQDTITKGIVLTANTSEITVKRVDFNTAFNTSSVITGSASEASATVSNVSEVGDSLAMGNNAVINTTVVVANGVATAVEVVDSGYGYIDDIEVSLINANSVFAITGRSNVATQGIGSGFWTGVNAHLNSAKKLHDNRYYQEFSYDLQTGISIDRYRDIVQDVMHVAGTRLFGLVVKRSTISVPTSVTTVLANSITTSLSTTDFFAGAPSGLWYDFTDRTTLKQSATENILVVGDGESIASVADISGNGNDGTQGSASQQPLFAAVGFAEFDNTDDGIATSLPTTQLKNLVDDSDDIYAGSIYFPSGVGRWTISNNVTMTAQTAVDSANNTTMNRLIASSANVTTEVVQQQVDTRLAASTTYTLSIEVNTADANNLPYLVLGTGANTTAPIEVLFDLANTSVVGFKNHVDAGTYSNSAITELANNIVQCSFTWETATPSTEFVYIKTGNTYTAWASGYYMQGDGVNGVDVGRMQLEQGDSITTHQTTYLNGSGFSGQVAIATTVGHGIYDVGIPAGNTFYVGSDGSGSAPLDGLYPGGNVIHIIAREGQYTNNEVAAIETLVLSDGAGDFSTVANAQSFWDVGASSNVGNTILSIPDTLDFSTVTNARFAFRGLQNLKKFPNLDFSAVTNATSAWQNCGSLTSFPTLNTSSVVNLQDAWRNCFSLEQLPIIDTSKVTNLQGTWYDCRSLKSFPLIDTSNVTNFAATWHSCKSMTSFANIDTSSATSVGSAWHNCELLEEFPAIDTSKVTNFQRTWRFCYSLTSFPLIDVSNATSLIYAWDSCRSLTSFPAINTSSMTSLFQTWGNCIELESFPLIDTSNVTSFFATWNNCSSFISFPAINCSAAANLTLTWAGCSALTTFPAGVFNGMTHTDFDRTFQSCPLDANSVSNILLSVESNGTSNGSIDLDSGEAPTAEGWGARGALISRGWTVDTNPLYATSYDGTSDVSTWSTQPTGLATSGPQVTFSTWLKCDSNGIFHGVLGTPSSASNINVLIRSTGTLQVRVLDTAGGNVIYYVNVGPNNLHDGNPHHIAFSANRDANTTQVYIDGALALDTSYPTANDVNIFGGSVVLGIVSGFKFHGSMWETWFDDRAVDLSGNHFITADGFPANLGSDGSGPTGFQPVIYLPDGDATNNLGTGGNAVNTGAPASVTRPD